jgi:hypothetical protein
MSKVYEHIDILGDGWLLIGSGEKFVCSRGNKHFYGSTPQEAEQKAREWAKKHENWR